MENKMSKRTVRAAVFGVAVALLAAACSDADSTSAADSDADGETADQMEDMEDGEMAGMGMEDMNMGDLSATRADEVVGAALASGSFELMETRPEGYDATSGTAWVARHGAGTTVTVELSGLIPDVDYISHLHADTCAAGGGDHYQFEVGGAEVPPNEVHLAFTSDGDGNGFMTAENADIVGLEAVALVVHPVELIDNKIACVDFVEASEGAAAAMIDAGLDESHDESHDDGSGDVHDDTPAEHDSSEEDE